MQSGDVRSPDLSTSRPLLSAEDLIFRLVNIEFEQTRNGPIYHLFGSLADGVKVCAHIAGYFAYILVKLDPASALLHSEELQSMINEWLFECEIKQAKTSRYRQRQKYVQKVEVVERFDVYGYHSKKEKFAKIFFFDAKYRKMAAKILSDQAEKNEAIFGTVFEAHFPPHLQFMVDNSLFGMDLVTISLGADKLAFRIPKNMKDEEKIFGSVTVRRLKDQGLFSNQEKRSTCFIELDAHVDAISNSKLYQNNEFSSNPGIETIWVEERERCANMGVGFTDFFRESFVDKPDCNGIGLEKHQREALVQIAEKRSGVVTEDSSPLLQSQLIPLDAGYIEQPDIMMIEEETRDGFPAGGSNIQGMDDLETSMMCSQAHYNSQQANEDVFDDERSNDGFVNGCKTANSMKRIIRSPSPGFDDSWKDKRDRGSETPPGPSNAQLSEDQYLVRLKGKRLLLGKRRDDKVNMLDQTIILDTDESGHNLSSTDQTITLSDSSQELFDTTFYDTTETAYTDSPANRTVHDLFSDSRPPSEFTFASESAVLQHTLFNAEHGGEIGEIRGLSIASIELIVDTSTFYPNPQKDPILGACICFYQSICTDFERPDNIYFISIFSKTLFQPKGVDVIEIQGDDKELQILSGLAELINRFDPDILVGYDVDRLSWGFLINRGNIVYENCRCATTFYQEISRIQNVFADSRNDFQQERREMAKDTIEEKYFGSESPTAPHGRMIFNGWRIVRKEDLRSYDRGTASRVFLQKEIPLFSTNHIASWIRTGTSMLIRRACEYILMLTQNTVDILVAIDFFQKTAEMARVYGILFMEVKTRGSQYRVESILLRLARVKDFALTSISQTSRATMKKPEFIQLIMEPEHGVYLEPVVVLDFQSLYPSMMIAYNLCFSTCMGKMSELSGDSSKIVFGGGHYGVPNDELHELVKKDRIHLSTNNALFATNTVRVGLLPQMVEEILATRLIVKHSMRFTKDKKTRRLLNARQLALKLVANVTYGYTAANWSGRMPCVEVADAILSNGRSTLENAIGLAKEIDPTVRVIYGDTDSLFIHCPGKSVNEAFAIGDKLAELVDRSNPSPVCLKVEKVYKGLALFSKKHYAGMKIEKPDGVGEFESKGIETIRRDACLLTSKLYDELLRMLFAGGTRKDVDQAVSDCVRSLPLRDFYDFALSRDYRPPYGIPCGQSVVGKQLSGPSYFRGPMWKERITFVVCRTNNPEKDPVWMGAKSLDFFNKNYNLLINHHYYAKAHILGPIQRLYGLKGWTINDLPAIGSLQITAHFFRSAIQIDSHMFTFAFTAQTRQVSRCRRICRQCFQGDHQSSPSSCLNSACPNKQLYDKCRRDLKTIAGLSPMYHEKWKINETGIEPAVGRHQENLKELTIEVRDYIKMVEEWL